MLWYGDYHKYWEYLVYILRRCVKIRIPTCTGNNAKAQVRVFLKIFLM